MIAAPEAFAHRLDPQTPNKLRMGVCNVLSKAKPPTDNIGRGMRRALRGLKCDSSIVILPADKGNITVIMDRKDYDVNIYNLLSEGITYRKIKKNPTTQTEKKITESLKDLCKEQWKRKLT